VSAAVAPKVSAASTVAELRAAAKAKGLKGYAAMTKPQLVKALKLK
jgi:large subunit ribosomal protein L19e